MSFMSQYCVIIHCYNVPADVHVRVKDYIHAREIFTLAGSRNAKFILFIKRF